MHMSPQIAIERCAFAKSGFLIGCQTVLSPKSRRGRLLMLFVPIVHNFIVVLAEPGSLFVVLIGALPSLLRVRLASGDECDH